MTFFVIVYHKKRFIINEIFLKLSTPHGLVAGDLDYYSIDRVHIDCRIDRNVGFSWTNINQESVNSIVFKLFIYKGTIIPNQTFAIRRFQSNALFVIIVEKHATFMRLIDDNFLEKYPAILITVRMAYKR